MNKEATLGGTVRDRRLALGYSLGQLATKVNKTAASIRSWERSETVPTEEETAALSDALDLDPDLLASLRDASLTAAPPAVEPVDVAPAEPDIEDPGEPEDEPADEAAAPLPAEEPSEQLEAAAAAGAEVVEDSPPAEPAPEAVDDEAGPEAVEEHPDIDSETQGGEALVEEVAALAAAGFADDDEAAAEPLKSESPGSEAPQAPVAPAGVAVATDPSLHEAMTEAVPVVPVAPVGSAAAIPEDARIATGPHTAPRSSNPVVQAWDNVVDTYHRVFDPRRKWIYRVRWVLLLIAFYIMLRVLGWAGGELWEAIGEVLDGIAFTPSETPDVSN